MSDPNTFAVVAERLLGSGRGCHSGDDALTDFAGRVADAASALCPGCDVGVLLIGAGGTAAVGGSTVSAHDLQGRAIDAAEGPTADALRTGHDVVGGSLSNPAWPAWGAAAGRLGYRSAHAIALTDDRPGSASRVTLGVITVLDRSAQPTDLGLVSALASLVAADLARESALSEARTTVEGLERALSSRIEIEQAKGMVAQRWGVPMESAFGSLRRHARSNNERLADLCAAITSGEIELDAIHVDFFAMSPARRAQLKKRALVRLTKLRADSLKQRERAAQSISRSVELRLEVQHRRALREVEAIGRVVDRQFRETSPGTPPEGTQPSRLRRRLPRCRPEVRR